MHPQDESEGHEVPHPKISPQAMPGDRGIAKEKNSRSHPKYDGHYQCDSGKEHPEYAIP
jgi:hypothetical protein